MNRIDKILIDGAAAGKSADELSRLVNGTLSPAQALTHVRTLLASRNVWELPEQKQLALLQLRELAESAAETYRKSKDSGDAALLLRVLTQITTVLDKQGSITEDELKIVSQAQAREIVAFFTSAIAYVDARLQETHPDIPAAVVRDVFMEAIAATRDDRYGA